MGYTMPDTRFFSLGALAAAALIAGCSMTPTLERPAAPVPATFPGQPASVTASVKSVVTAVEPVSAASATLTVTA